MVRTNFRQLRATGAGGEGNGDQEPQKECWELGGPGAVVEGVRREGLRRHHALPPKGRVGSVRSVSQGESASHPDSRATGIYHWRHTTKDKVSEWVTPRRLRHFANAVPKAQSGA